MVNLKYSTIKKKERYDLVMEAVGRIPNTKNLNLKSTNVKINNNGAIIVDKYFKTSVKNIFAIGDVIDRVQLTPVAIAEAMIFVNNLKHQEKDHSIIKIFQQLYSVIQTIHMLAYQKRMLKKI